jgi:hypothetical protein
LLLLLFRLLLLNVEKILLELLLKPSLLILFNNKFGGSTFSKLLPLIAPAFFGLYTFNALVFVGILFNGFLYALLVIFVSILYLFLFICFGIVSFEFNLCFLLYFSFKSLLLLNCSLDISALKSISNCFLRIFFSL